MLKVISCISFASWGWIQQATNEWHSSYFSQKVGLDNSCKLSKLRILFRWNVKPYSGEIIIKCHLMLIFLFGWQRVIRSCINQDGWSFLLHKFDQSYQLVHCLCNGRFQINYCFCFVLFCFVLFFFSWFFIKIYVFRFHQNPIIIKIVIKNKLFNTLLIKGNAYSFKGGNSV